MQFVPEFTTTTIGDLPELSHRLKAEGWRYVQTLAVNTEEGVDVVYSFMKDGKLVNYEIKAVQKSDVIPSISDDYLAAFVWENEIHDLFGITFEGIAIDFGGNFYALAVQEPMTIISPEQKAAREKARKVAAAKAAKEAGKQDGAAAKSDEEDMEAKLAAMDPEKAAKVRAAMEAKKKKEEAAAAEELEAKLPAMDPEKAAKVRAAMEAKAKKDAAKKEGE